MDIEKIRQFCLSLPRVTESVQWDDDLVFKVGGKMFVIVATEEFRLSFRCAPNAFAELIERQDIIPAPYLARHHWVSIERPNALRWTEAQELMRASYVRVFEKLPKKMKEIFK